MRMALRVGLLVWAVLVVAGVTGCATGRRVPAEEEFSPEELARMSEAIAAIRVQRGGGG